MTRSRTSSDTLPIDVKEPKASSTAVYQGVCATIRALFDARPDDAPDVAADRVERRQRMAGTIAQARSMAASIDRVSGAGPNGGMSQANGVPLSAMHAQLDALLLRLDPAEAGPDAFANLLDDMREEEERARAAAAAAAAPDARRP